jgi:hypothetical protein
MKKLLFLFIVIVSIISCKKENEMNIEATITGLKKGTVYLQKIKDSSLINLDSVVVNGQDIFTLSTIVEAPELFYLYVDKVDGTEYNDRVSFFGEKGDIKISTHLNKINYEVNITGSNSNKVYQKYLKSVKNINKQIGIVNIDFINAQLDKDEDKLINYNKRLDKLIKSKYLRSIQFALNNKTSAVAAYIASREIPDTNIKYLDSIYNSLSIEAKQSTYGKELSEIIKEKN